MFKQIEFGVLAPSVSVQLKDSGIPPVELARLDVLADAVTDLLRNGMLPDRQAEMARTKIFKRAVSFAQEAKKKERLNAIKP